MLGWFQLLLVADDGFSERIDAIPGITWLPGSSFLALASETRGYLYLAGRLDDVIVRGAENISPVEIEDVLCAHRCVTDAAAVGLPDDEWGERIVAAVVLREPATADELKEWVRKRLSSTRTPEEIFLVQQLPFNDTGKLLRRVLKKQLAETVRAD